MNKIYFYLGVLCMLVPFFGLTQTKEEENYRKESEELRKEIWGMKKEQFKVRDIPAEYAKQSKIVLAQHTELTADSKSKLVFNGPFLMKNKEQKIIEIVREMIKLNDKSAVDEYSELSFTKFKRTSRFKDADKFSTYLGVRIIKPNGKIQEVNADEIVLTKDGSNEKVAKLAIPDLQPGDIIDYYIASNQLLNSNSKEKNYQIILFDDAPILSYSFHAALGKKYAVEYRSYNGAPKMKVSKDEEESIIIDIEEKNIPPVEATLWVAPAQQLPFIRLSITLGLRAMEGGGRRGIAKPGEIVENKDSDAVLKEKYREISEVYYWRYWYKANRGSFQMVEDNARKKAKQLGFDYKQMAEEEKLALNYYTFRFIELLGFDINKLDRTLNAGQYEFNGLALYMYCTAKEAGIDAAILTAPPRTGFRYNEIMDKDDLAMHAFLPASKKFFYFNSIYDVPFTVPADFDGVKQNSSFTFRHLALAGPTSSFVEPREGFEVPASTAEKNAHLESLTINIAPNTGTMAVSRKTVVKGHFKEALQRQLILYEDFYEHERKAFKDEKSLLETLEENKKNKKFVDEAKNAFAEARKKHKDAFVSEAKNWFNQDITELKNYKVENLGVRHTAPDFIYSSEFNLSGIVKKAGNNLIVEIGKILGKQLVIKEAQRKRSLDVYNSFARSIENEIVLNIPDGYTVEGVSELNRNVVNETGMFTVEASANGKAITIKVKKYYLHNYESKENWDKMLTFLDAANDWLGAKLLFKKI